jgi:hypothetical protein
MKRNMMKTKLTLLLTILVLFLASCTTSGPSASGTYKEPQICTGYELQELRSEGKLAQKGISLNPLDWFSGDVEEPDDEDTPSYLEEGCPTPLGTSRPFCKTSGKSVWKLYTYNDCRTEEWAIDTCGSDELCVGNTAPLSTGTAYCEKITTLNANSSSFWANTGPTVVTTTTTTDENGTTVTTTADDGSPITGQFDVRTHIIIIDAETRNIYKNQTFSLRVDADQASVQTYTIDEDGTLSIDIPFDTEELNEVDFTLTATDVPENRVAPDISFSSFVPCRDTWEIRIPYSFKMNSSGDLLDVDTLVVYDGLEGGINRDNPVAVAPGDVLYLDFKLKSGGSGKTVWIEYDFDQIQRVRVQKDGDIIDEIFAKPEDEKIDRVGNREEGFGPLMESGTYNILLFVKEDVQPTTPMTVKHYNRDDLISAGDVYFIAKSAIVPQDDNTRIGIVVALIIIALLIMNGGRKR